MEINKIEIENISLKISRMGKLEWDVLINHQLKKDPVPWNDITEIRNKNMAQLKQVIEKYGWPKKSVFGTKTIHWTWYIAQHCDNDLPFQEKCLELIKELPKEEIDLYDLAHLEDRVKINQHRPQLYGTQYVGTTEKDRKLQPVEEPKKLEQRRKEMGLDQSFQNHHEQMIGESI